MTVYIDKLREYPTKIKGNNKWCHLIADSLSELESFARKLNLSSSWLQTSSHLHYDLTEGKRNQALKMGAIEVTDKELVEIIRRKQ